jgi:hypothetical protein
VTVTVIDHVDVDAFEISHNRMCFWEQLEPPSISRSASSYLNQVRIILFSLTYRLDPSCMMMPGAACYAARHSTIRPF